MMISLLFSEYMASLTCYQEILNNETLQECDYIYKDLKPWLYSVSAFQFYCKDNSEDTLKMQMYVLNMLMYVM
jgi:hypothetical protein